MKNRNVDAHQYLLEKSHGFHERIYNLIKTNGSLEVQSHSPDALFVFLARTAVGQQLSAKAARSIWNKIEALHLRSGCELRKVFRMENTEKIRNCGVSGNKIRAIIGLREALDSNSIHGQDVLNSTYIEVSNKITSLWGFGNWSADMCAMFFCGLPDVYPQSDVAIQQGIKRLCGEGDSPEDVAKRYAPYRTYLCRHVWIGLDTGYID